MTYSIKVLQIAREDYEAAAAQGASHYEIMADMLRADAKLGSWKEREATLYEAMATIEKTGGLERVLDTAALNDHIRAYAALAMEEAKLPTEQLTEVLRAFSAVFDEYCAEEALTRAKGRKWL